MILCDVVGTQVASEKHALYDGTTILWVRPWRPAGAPPFLAIDTVGAGVGERVLVVCEGGAATLALRRPRAPLDAAIVGIVDDGEPLDDGAMA